MSSTKALPSASTTKRTAFSSFLVITSVLCWLVCTIAQVEKYLSLPRAAMVCGAGCCGVIVTLFLLQRTYLSGWDVSWWPLVALFGVLTLSFAVLYPKSQHHAPGKGSDREDALRVELYAVTHHQYPYAARTYLGHPPTPLPGAMWLAAPFYLAGRIALQNLLWLGFFIMFLTHYFRARITALAFVFLFLLSALENLNDFDVGGDYVTNILYVAIAIFLFSRAIEQADLGWLTWMAVALLGCALSSRILYVVSVPPLIALAWQSSRPKRAGLLVGAVLLTAIAVTVPVFLPHPIGHLGQQISQNADKLSLLPSYVSHGLPVLAMGVACCGFFVRLNVERLFLLVGTASLVMIGPPMLLFVVKEGGLARPMTTDLEYLATSAIFLALWVFARWEQIGQTPKGVSVPGTP